MLSLIDELEDLVQRAIHIPTSGKIIIDEAALRDILDQMREAVPDEVRLGQRIAGERERILADARAQARRMVEESQKQMDERLDEHGIVQAAYQRAREIERDAYKRADTLRGDANQYVVSQLHAMETRLLRLLREVQAGQSALSPDSSSRSEDTAKS